ncbi:helix-turn-helix domain-containing protein [Ideonella sp. DXS22W]|uniref:Helix-turn-helix domain-containing protein n=1 Tax=Pseudaquabacterium inlustre TaxID=2984192 RepID=A0ABU9CK01_9BURK
MHRSDPEPAAPDCTPDCPVRRTAQIIDGKWTTQIVRDLLPGRRRYSALLAGLPGISPKILAQRLRLLEAQGLLTKTVYPEVPPRTEYELTPLGRRLEGVIREMAAFGEALAALPQPPR